MPDIEAVNAVSSQEDGQDEGDRGALELQAADLRPLGVVQLEQPGTNKGNLLFGKILAIGMINMSTFCASIMVCVIYDSFVIFCCKVNTFLAIRERFVQKVTLLVGKNHFFGAVCIDSVTELHPLMTAVGSPVIDSVYSTVTLFARFLGISTSRPLSTAT